MYYQQGGIMQIKRCVKNAIKFENQQKLNEFCKTNKISKEQLYQQNNTTSFNKNDIILVPKPYSKMYVVKPLDTIQSIANALEVDTNTIICATSGKIFVGQKIFL